MTVTCEQMKQAEDRLFATGVLAEGLMEKAGLGCARAIMQFFPRRGRASLYVGKGNNGGDALVIGRHLREQGWRVEVVLSGEPSGMSGLAARKLAEFEATAETPLPPTSREGPAIVVDGLLGIGARGPLRGVIGERAEQINRQRIESHATCFAVDIPSGLDGDRGSPHPGAVIADITLSIAAVKAGLVQDAALNHVGRIAQIPLPEIALEGDGGDSVVLSAQHLAGILPRRDFAFHKGRAGRVGILAGSRGMTGAAVLASTAALHSGAGLVTLYAAKDIYEILAATAPPEVMVKPVDSPADIGNERVDVLAVGPGLGEAPDPALLDLLWDDPRPMVVDADALNLIARSGEGLDRLVENQHPRLLTPHPGEMARLFPAAPSRGDRAGVVKGFLKQHAFRGVLLYKGARTLIASAGQPLAINSTGHPGMATGGVGDVLTGLCAGLAAQGASLYDAACLGSWLIGRAAEKSIFEGHDSAESLKAGTVSSYLGAAFGDLRQQAY